ncbi:SAM-dependent methyltransferase [Sphingomonas sp.]|uniref:class I SAM-dependent methyltransferase n=1 Tax=Sphingomonas sp. TaxID=28214 RepID=UPI002C7FE04E|nr:SAM-dependent methyltransferase [Sphingomonas sp.]HTG38015.1 SAM-dependent methyltransferase [Sphingomonas sp.]
MRGTTNDRCGQVAGAGAVVAFDGARKRRKRKAGGRSNGLPDMVRFLLAWVRNPAGTAAIAPSGPALAALMTQEITGDTGPVLELGPGTGVLTHRLIDRGVAERDLTLVEQNPAFARLLSLRFPKAAVLGIDAAALARVPRTGDGFGAVICGLGLRNMDDDQVAAIVKSAFGHMRADGAFYLFTYARGCSVSDEILDALDLVAERVGMTIRNVPPAWVYRLTRRAAAAE